MALYPRIPLATLIDYDPTILDAFYYPAAAKENFLSYFQLEYGEMMPIYQKPDLLKEHIRVLAAALKPTIDKWEEVLQLEYNPIENYDRYENGGDTRTPDLTDARTLNLANSETVTKNETGTNNQTVTHNETTTHGKGETITGGHTDSEPQHTVEHKVSADNTSAYYEADKTITDKHDTVRTYQSEKTQESGTTAVNGSDVTTGSTGLTGSTGTTGSNTGTDTMKHSGKETTIHNWRIHGNVGVTTSQQMLEAELDVRRFIFMEEVGRLYAERFLVMLY